MQLTIDTSEKLDDVLRVVGAAYGVTLTVGDGAAGTARPGRGGTRSRRRGSGRRSAVAGSDVRAWARAHGYEVSDRGRIAGDVMAAYRAAQR